MISINSNFTYCVFLFFLGKINDDISSNNNKWTGSCNTILHQSKQPNLSSGLSNHHSSSHHHHHHHAALSAAALSSPFSSLLSAGGGAGYILDPLGGLSKPTATNHLF